MPEMGKDRVTLITCTPYGVNTDRLLVTGDRVLDYKEEQINEAVSSKQYGYFEILYISLFVFVITILLFIVFKKIYKRNKSE